MCVGKPTPRFERRDRYSHGERVTRVRETSRTPRVWITICYYYCERFFEK